MSLKLASISIDLDEVTRYAAIHGLPAPRGQASHAVYDRCVPRLAAWLGEESVEATFFAIGEDLERERNREPLTTSEIRRHAICRSWAHYKGVLQHASEAGATKTGGGGTAESLP